MPRANNNSPLSDRKLRALIGPACFVECALAAGRIWNHEPLEHFARKGEAPFEEVGSTQPWQTTLETNMFRMMLKDRVPELETFRTMEIHLAKGRPKFKAWREHIFWDLLMKKVSHEIVMRALNGIGGKQRECLFIETIRGKRGELGLRGSSDMSVMRRLYKLGGLDALIALVATARESQLRRILIPHHHAAFYSRKAFPKVVAQSPHLYIRWRQLSLILAERVWCPPETDESVLWFNPDIGGLDAEVESNARRSRRAGIQLPPENLVRTPKGWPAPKP